VSSIGVCRLGIATPKSACSRETASQNIVDQMTQRTKTLAACLVLGCVGLLLPLPEGLSEEARRTAVIGAVMAAFWMTEVLPLAVSALIPVIAFPLAGIAPMNDVNRAYAHPLIFLFLGGFILASAMQRWGLHLRLSQVAIRLAGPRHDHQVLAIMIATAFLSMWISNTATAMVMMPIGLSMLALPGDRGRGSKVLVANDQSASEADGTKGPYGSALMLGIAFSATIGGMGTLIGTPPNALFAGFIERTYGMSIGFGQWMLMGVPIVLVLLPIAWLLLTRIAFPLPSVVEDAVPKQVVWAPLSRAQKIVAIVLLLTVLAWLLRPLADASLGQSGLTDAGIGLIGAITLFLLPASFSDNEPLLTWDDVKELRWDVLILFGGGLALANGIAKTGLADWIGSGANQLAELPIHALILIMMVAIVYLGELASNTAVAAVFLPLAGAVAVGLGIAPITLLLPVALAASLGFMLPVATPPNAIVYGSGAVTSGQMLKAGAVLDVVSIVIVFVFSVLLGPVVFDMRGG
jgi:sodium-dependent dicarboxylate transporter 2/3/5